MRLLQRNSEDAFKEELEGDLKDCIERQLKLDISELLVSVVSPDQSGDDLHYLTGLLLLLKYVYGFNLMKAYVTVEEKSEIKNVFEWLVLKMVLQGIKLQKRQVQSIQTDVIQLPPQVP